MMMMRMMMRMGAAGTPHPPTTHSSSSIKVNITVPLHTWTFSASLSHSSREGRHLCMSFYFIFLSLVSAGWEALTLTLTPRLPACLPTCVIVWPLSACLPQRAVLCSSPHPLSTTPLQIPTDWPLLFLLFPRLRAARRNWPHPHQRPLCIKSETTAAPESVLSKPLALRLHPAVITESMDGDVWFVFFEFFFFFIVVLFVLKFADIVAVFVDDCFWR